MQARSVLSFTPVSHERTAAYVQTANTSKPMSEQYNFHSVLSFLQPDPGDSAFM